MDIKAFKVQWSGWFPNAPPLGHLLRELIPDVWLRIHSLPDSKRYAESTAEWRELLYRQNSAATALLGAGRTCVVVVARFAAIGVRMHDQLASNETNEPDALVALNPTLVGPLDDSWPGTNAVRAHYEDSRVWLYAAPIIWKSGGHDALLRSVASDETGRVVIVECSSGRVYAPYDGGADLFFRTQTEKREAGELHRAWLSPLSSGL